MVDLSKPGLKARPFVKWAGGKGQLLPELLKRVPETFERYFEPFLGGGALFFALQPPIAVLGDIGEELIGAYLAIQCTPQLVIEELKKYRYDEGCYYTTRMMDREPGFQRLPIHVRAARFLYINRCGFNGLWRVNKNGHCNVPFGRYTNPTICDEELIMACHQALQGQVIQWKAWHGGVQPLYAGDFVYLDPPYQPVSATSNFVGYAAGGFGEDKQKLLANWLKMMDRNGVKWMLSKSFSPLILELYKDFHVDVVKARRQINSKQEKRGTVDEVIIRNYINESEK